MNKRASYLYLPENPGLINFFYLSIPRNILTLILTIIVKIRYNIRAMLAGEESSLAPLPFPNLGASTASTLSI